jgi:hypothetical protein
MTIFTDKYRTEINKIIGDNKMKYTDNQITEFVLFCNNHGIRFNNMTEYNSALKQYYTDDSILSQILSSPYYTVTQIVSSPYNTVTQILSLPYYTGE